MKLHILLTCAMIMSGTITMAQNNILASDSFEYATTSQLASNWTISTSGFTKPVSIKLSSNVVREGRKALQISMPTVSADTNGRIDLDIYPKVSLGSVKQIRFWLYLDNPSDIAQSGIHCGNDDWSQDFAKFGYTKNIKGWQRVSISTSGFVVSSGTPRWNAVNHMRITFWFAKNAKPAKIILDDMVWSDSQERAQQLNGDWFE